jgi:alkanesulfonate monooxygenase SsuD/methylene tetrahydromethanopterin reductase-like flavin-dependent oxidoreductase (luciferase family)
VTEGAETLIGISMVPEASAWPRLADVARAADEAGLDLIGIQDHPYQWRFLDTFALIADLLARTERIRIFPDVANLPLRPPAMLAKAAGSLDRLSGGRFELGLGAGSFWDAIVAMGGPRRTPAEAVGAVAEAIEVIRRMWSGERSVSFEGEHYRLKGIHPGDAPPHPIGIWIGGYGPRMLRLIGRLADGWIPSYGMTAPEALRSGNQTIDEAAHAAGRDQREVRRLLNIGGAITAPGPGDRRESAPSVGRIPSDLAGPPAFWHELLDGFREMGFDAFVVWLPGEEPTQIARLAHEVAPLVRESIPRGLRPDAYHRDDR